MEHYNTTQAARTCDSSVTCGDFDMLTCNHVLVILYYVVAGQRLCTLVIVLGIVLLTPANSNSTCSGVRDV